MRTAREVIAEARYERAKKELNEWEWDDSLDDIAEWFADASADIAALRAEGLVIVAAADLSLAARVLQEGANTRRQLGVETRALMEARDRLGAALAAGGTDGNDQS